MKISVELLINNQKQAFNEIINFTDDYALFLCVQHG